MNITTKGDILCNYVKNIKQFCLIVSVSILVLQLVGCVNSTKVLKSSKQPDSYPIDSTVLTTLENTVVPVAVPSNSPKLLPNEVSKYSQYGYGVWKTDAGLSYQKRLDIMPPAYTGTSATSNGSLLRFFTMSDMHITDKQSPGTIRELSGTFSTFKLYITVGAC